MNYLFYRLTNLNIHKPVYWARIFIAIIQGIVLLPIYMSLAKLLLGISGFNENESVKWMFFFVALTLWILNLFYYNPRRIKKIDRKYSEEKGFSIYLKVGIIILLLMIWILKAGDIIRLIADVPIC